MIGEVGVGDRSSKSLWKDRTNTPGTMGWKKLAEISIWELHGELKKEEDIFSNFQEDRRDPLPLALIKLSYICFVFWEIFETPFEENRKCIFWKINNGRE